MLSVEELGQFKDEGFLVVRQLAAAKQLADLSELTRQGLASQLAPFELEADVQYPGAPMSRNASGGQTVRRLLQAYQRHPVFREWASNAGLTSILRQLLGCDTLLLSQAHHNCVMTKQPKYSLAPGCTLLAVLATLSGKCMACVRTGNHPERRHVAYPWLSFVAIDGRSLGWG